MLLFDDDNDGKSPQHLSTTASIISLKNPPKNSFKQEMENKKIIDDSDQKIKNNVRFKM